MSLSIVFKDPELAKEFMNEHVDKGVDKVGELTKGLMKEGVDQLPTVAPLMSTVLKPVVATGVTVLTQPCPSITPVAVSVSNVAVEKSVACSADYCVAVSKPQVDPCVDSSTDSIKMGTHQSVDNSVDSTVSSVETVSSVTSLFN